MLNLFCALLQKDIILILRKHGQILQAFLLGILLIFIFSLSRETGEKFSPGECATIFWISSIFCSILLFAQLYNFEEENGVKILLFLSPYPLQGIWLAKAVSGMILLLISQFFFYLASIIFLELYPPLPTLFLLLALLICDLGLCALGSLLGALCQGQSARDALLSILFFPLLTPLILAGINLGSIAFGNLNTAELSFWFQIACSFTAIFFACGLVLSGFIFKSS